jgi:hypothetical protein
MKALLLVLPVLIAAMSGCITPELGGSGMVITAFEPSFSNVYSGEPVDFVIRVQNRGTVDAIDVTPMIIGLETWSMDGATCDGWDRISSAEPSIGSPGESENCRWTFVAPDVPKGLTTDISPTVRLFYGYRTSIVKSVFLASSKELKLMMERGEAPPTQTMSQTMGPLQVDIKTEAPVRFWQGYVKFPIAITINNVGGGVVCPSVGDCENGNNLNHLKLDMEFGSDVDISDCENEIELWQGKTNTLVCHATFGGLSDVGLAQRSLSVSMDYGYYIDESTKVSITSR